MLLILQIFITLFCLSMLIHGALNLVRFRLDRRLARRQALPAVPPLISVCVPARNEVRNIAACLESLARQDYPHFEVLALDDCSTDGTFEIAEEISRRHPHVHVLRGQPLEPGWIGKPHACRQLGEAARGEWLLFTDADTSFPPNALAQALRLALSRRADLLSGIPRMETITVWERLSVPMVALLSLGMASFDLVSRLPWAWYGGASGAFLFFKRETYEAIGGHRAVFNRIVDDVGLGRATKSAGRRLVMTDLTRLVNCRMYTTFGEVWEGFTKNFYSVFPKALSPLAILFLFGIFTAPWLSFVFGPALGWGTWEATVLPLVQIVAIGVLKGGVDRRFGMPSFADLLLTPLAGLMMAVIAIRSTSRALLRQPTPWRAREYELWKS